MLKKVFKRSEFESYFQHSSILEDKLQGIPVRTEINEDNAIVEYIPVKNRVFYIDVWDCNPRFAKRIHLSNSQIRTEIIVLKNKKARDLFDKLIDLRNVIINMSGHYYIETLQQKKILDEIVIAENLFCCKDFENCDEFIEGNCPLSENCPEYQKP